MPCSIANKRILPFAVLDADNPERDVIDLSVILFTMIGL
jgi:hypothetical protein